MPTSLGSQKISVWSKITLIFYWVMASGLAPFWSPLHQWGQQFNSSQTHFMRIYLLDGDHPQVLLTNNMWGQGSSSYPKVCFGKGIMLFSKPPIGSPRDLNPQCSKCTLRVTPNTLLTPSPLTKDPFQNATLQRACLPFAVEMLLVSV